MYLAAGLPPWRRKIYEKVFREKPDLEERIAPGRGCPLRHLRVSGILLRTVALRMPAGFIFPVSVLPDEFRAHTEIVSLCVRAVGNLRAAGPVAHFSGQ